MEDYYDFDDLSEMFGSRLKCQKNGCKPMIKKNGEYRRKKDGGIVFRCKDIAKPKKRATSKRATSKRVRKTDRPLTAYQKFMSKELKRLNKSNPAGKKNRVNFKKAVALWRKSPGYGKKHTVTRKTSGSKSTKKRTTIKQVANRFEENKKSGKRYIRDFEELCFKLVKMSPQRRYDVLAKLGYSDSAIKEILNNCELINILKKKQ